MNFNQKNSSKLCCGVVHYLPLWKRGIKGDFIIIKATNPPSPPFTKGGIYRLRIQSFDAPPCRQGASLYFDTIYCSHCVKVKPVL
jgi:hypothetical protein